MVTDDPSPAEPETGTDRLRPPAFRPLPLGGLRPAGWLERQLRTQAGGLTGHLDEFWPDVADSAWIGGSGDGWERGPYWLDGVVPLAFLLGDERLTAKVRRWAGHILDHQHEDGWLGPRTGNPGHHAGPGDHDVWPRMVVLKALLQYRQATGDPRVLPAALRLARLLDGLLDREPLDEWARARWADLVWALHQLHDLTGEPWLLELAATVMRQGYDWTGWAERFPYPDKVPDEQLRAYQRQAGGVWLNDDYLATHGANVAMGLKAPAVWWRQAGDARLRRAFDRMVARLDAHHGQATGLFTCDEHLAGPHPSQGTETCTVVEQLFSLALVLETWGTMGVADRWERLAFNALPAPVSPDAWAHQYVQQANQVVAHVTEDRRYTNNGPDANVFGLEPHFGCCTANRHQGWPKFAARLWLATADDGLAAVSYAPCTVDTVVRGSRVRVEVDTDYPFEDDVRISVRSRGPVTFPLRLRIPAWAERAELAVDGRTLASPRPGSFHELHQEWSGTHTVHLRLPAGPRVTRRYSGSVAVERGPLVFALQVGEDWRQIGGEQPHADWAVHPTTPWNYALELDPDRPERSLRLDRRPVGDRPFSPDGAPLRLHATGRRLEAWGLEHGAAAAPPPSPVGTDTPPEDLVLVPYGCTNLRVTELPWLEPAPEDVG